MNNESNRRIAACAVDFALPRYAELPSVGLYLDQTVQYVNGYFRAFPGVELAGLIYIVVSKTVLSMENIDTLFKMQRQHYSAAQAYDYFCEEVENCLPYVFGLTHTIRDLAADAGEEKLLLRSTIIAAVNKMFLDCAFAVMHQEQALWPDILADLA